MDINLTIIGQIITFALLVMFTMKFVWPPINKMLEERKLQIANGFIVAKKAKQELLDAKNIANEELKQAQIKVNEMMNNTNNQAITIIADAKVIANNEKQKIVKSAQDEISNDINKSKEYLKTQISSLIIDGVKKILETEINQTKHQQILDNIIKDIH